VPTVRGVVVHGAKRGRELGFPTANLSPDSDGLIPADGIYAGWFEVDGDVYPSAISVGNNPTFDGVPHRQVEAYLLDQDIDLYGKVVDVRFVERIRGMVAYEGIDPLIAQMTNDVERAREVLSRS
jgi:riboflavin kinase/FMN adenylyltransferase